MTPSHYQTIAELGEVHRQTIVRAITSVLATDLALWTYAQIIDGLPLSNIAWDTRGSRLVPWHPINSHETLCPGALEKAKSFRDEFDPNSLVFKPEVLQAFGSSERSSRTFSLRLLEMTTSALHNIAVHLFQLKTELHDPSTTDGLGPEAVTLWEREPDEWARIEPHATLFVQTHFLAYEKYPDGIADMVGYWAEDRITGGVLLFDHSQAWSDDKNPEPNAYTHPNRDKVTFRICQLLDDQQSQLLGFLTSKDGPGTTETHDGPLPMLPNLTNRVRVDQMDAIPVHQIYRDLWERPLDADQILKPGQGLAWPAIWIKWWSEANAVLPNRNVGMSLFIDVISNTAYLLHDDLLESTLRASYRLFTKTDVKGLTNRFSQDLELVDMELPVYVVNFGTGSRISITN
ncbi:hypothetical protein NLU13_8174 [Sarocladium strictum]|uniref:Uncharacterized protein n=1 Tax=Sarocladium strictum TaxID=5046 RepID=A0AA39GB61_SARSR|nr:hypothetical protein NLU13_8174 [Sarocladium strictum]